jgi:predicted RecB family nuclease
MAWTYSALEKFETCPRQYYHVRVARDVVEPPTEHTIWGEKVHAALEARVLTQTPLPESMQQWEPIAAQLAGMPGEKLTEHKLAVDEAFQPAEWNSCWSRGIADLIVKQDGKALVVDHKTGKRKPTEQLALYAGFVFAHFPDVDEIQTGFIWLKEKKIDKQTYRRVDVPSIWQQFLPRVRKLRTAEAQDTWQAKPSGLCKGWCPVKHCEFYKERST